MREHRGASRSSPSRVDPPMEGDRTKQHALAVDDAGDGRGLWRKARVARLTTA